MGASQVPEATKALLVPRGRLVVLAPKALKDYRARRVSEVPQERVWQGPLGSLGPLVREASRGGQGLPAPEARREKPP